MKQRSPRGRVVLGPHGWQAVEDPRSGTSLRRRLAAFLVLLAIAAGAFLALRPERPVATAHDPAKAPATMAEGRWGPSPFAPALPPSLQSAAATPTPAGPGSGTTTAASDPAARPAWELDFKAARARFDDLRWSGNDGAALRNEARQAELKLPALLAEGHIEAGDALLLKADLLDVLEPEVNRRSQQLIAWWSEHPLPRPASRAPAYRQTEALRREEALLVEWQAQPSGDRDVHALEEQVRQLWAAYR